MRILMALSRFPYPTLKGDRLRAYYQLRELSRHHEVHLLCLSENQDYLPYLAHIASLCASVEVVPLSSRHKFANLMKGLFRPQPFQVHYFTSSRFRNRLEKLIREKHIDVCYVQLLRLGANLPDERRGCVYFLDYMDALSAGMEKRLAWSRFYERPFVRAEARRLKRYEAELSRRFDGYSVIATTDKAAFPPEIQARLHIIPNGIDPGFLSWQTDNPEGSAPAIDLIFTGNMSYHPNIVAARYLVQEILPDLQRTLPNLNIALVGTDPAPEVRALAGNGVEVTGFVEDIRPWLGRARLFVAPLWSGSGMQNKLLEAMALGLPVLTTPLAAQALEANAGHEIGICSSASAFQERIRHLLTHPEAAHALGRGGQAFVRARYNWAAACRRLTDIFSALLNGTSSHTP